MITDAILNLFSLIFKFIMSIIPEFTFITNLVNAKDSFIQFISGFMAYTLYLFNVPVLRLAVNLLFIYLTFLVSEYAIKLAMKYLTNLF